MPTKKMLCSCKHESQDRLHGNQVRVFNETVSKSKETQSYRCTVCGNMKDRKGE